MRTSFEDLVERRQYLCCLRIAQLAEPVYELLKLSDLEHQAADIDRDVLELAQRGSRFFRVAQILQVAFARLPGFGSTRRAKLLPEFGDTAAETLPDRV